MFIDSKFNLPDRIVSTDACADMRSLVAARTGMFLLVALWNIFWPAAGIEMTVVLILGANLTFKTHPGG